MQNAFPDWLFNVLLLGGIVGLLVLAFQVFAAPILGAMTMLVAHSPIKKMRAIICRAPNAQTFGANPERPVNTA